MSTTLNRKDEALPWLVLTGMLSARRCTWASKEKIGKKCMTPTRQRAKLWIFKKAAGGPEGKSPVGHESSKGQQGRVL